jgi:hypothetical protein
MELDVSDLLNSEQFRSVEITLRMFEENLRLTSSWLDGEEENGILYHRKLNSPAERRKSARQRINAALHQISILARILELPTENKDATGLIRARLAESWANLIDRQSGKLKRYGDVDPRAETILDPIIQRLAELAKELEYLFEC